MLYEQASSAQSMGNGVEGILMFVVAETQSYDAAIKKNNAGGMTLALNAASQSNLMFNGMF